MGIFDRFLELRRPPRRRALTQQERDKIDQLLRDDPSLTEADLGEEVGCNQATVHRYLTRRQLVARRTVEDVMAEAEVKILSKLVESPDGAFQKVLSDRLLQRLSPTPPKSEIDQIKETMKAAREFQEMFAPPGRDEPFDPRTQLADMMEMVRFVRDMTDEISPHEESTPWREAFKTVRELAPVLLENVKPGALASVARMLASSQNGGGGYGPGGGQPTVRMESPAVEALGAGPPAESDTPALGAGAQPPALVPESEEPTLATWLTAIQTVQMLLGQDVEGAAWGLWHAAEFAVVCGNRALYAALVRLATLSEDDARAIFASLIKANPKLLLELQPLMTKERGEWLAAVQVRLRAILEEQAEAEAEEPEEEETPEAEPEPDGEEPKRKRGRPRKAG